MHFTAMNFYIRKKSLRLNLGTDITFPNLNTCTFKILWKEKHHGYNFIWDEVFFFLVFLFFNLFIS